MSGLARSQAHSGQFELARESFQKLISRYPDDMDYRNQLAGLLFQQREFREAVAVFNGVTPNKEGRILLVLIHATAGDNNAAVDAARALLKLYPNDPTAEGLLADLLQKRGDHNTAKGIYERLLKADPNNMRIAIQLAHGSLSSKPPNYAEALQRFQAIFDHHRNDPDFLTRFPDLPRGWVNAAASASRIGPAQRQTARMLADHVLLSDEKDPGYLARLAWVLQRLKEEEGAAALLERAIALAPDDLGVRRQIAGTLVGLGKPKEALKLLQGRETDFDARLLMVDLHAAAGEFAEGIIVCKDLLKEQPDNVNVRSRLADVYSWDHQYDNSIDEFSKLAQDDPKNPYFPLRLAQVTLWSGKYRDALNQFQKMLTANFDQPALWWDLIDAAAGVKELTESQADVIRAIADKVRLGEHRSKRVIDEFQKQGGRPVSEETFLSRLGWVLLSGVKDVARANAILDRAVELKPVEPAVRKELSGVLAAAGRSKEALKLYTGLTLDEAERLTLVRLYAADGNFEVAAREVRQFLVKQPLNREANLLLADILAWGGHHGEALALLQKLQGPPPGDPEVRRREAQVLLWSGNHTRALQVFEEMIAKTPTPELERGFIEAAGLADRLTPAQTEVVKRIAAGPLPEGPDQAGYLASLAWVRYHYLNEPEKAKELLRRAVAAAQRDPATLARLALITYRTGDRATAITLLDKALADKPTSRSLRRELAGVLLATKRFSDALAMLEPLAKEAPDDPSAQALLAQATFWAGKTSLAMPRLYALLEKDFEQPSLWSTFVDAAGASKGLLAKQRSMLSRLVDKPAPDTGTDPALYWSRLAWVLHREGFADKSKTVLARALALEPRDAATRLELAGVLVACGRAKEALPWLEDLAKAKPDDADLQQRLAQATLWAGNPAKAVDRLAKALESNPDNPDLVISFVDAASAVPKGTMTKPQQALLDALVKKKVPEQAADKAVYLSRLAWALHREGKTKLAGLLLDQAIALVPRDPNTRRELAGVMIALGRSKKC